MPRVGSFSPMLLHTQKKLEHTRIVDMATLTGAVSIALGDVNVAVLGTDQELD